MNLTAPQVARLLEVPLRTVDRWMERDGLPATRVQQEHRIHRVELFDWAASRGMHLPPQLFAVGGIDVARCAAALAEGGLHSLSTAGGPRPTAERLLESLGVVEPAAAPIVAARPGLGFVVVREGIAVPRLHAPLVIGGRAAVAGFRLDGPLPDLGATALLAVAAPSVRVHRALVEILYLALDEAPFRTALLGSAPLATLVAMLHPRPEAA